MFTEGFILFLFLMVVAGKWMDDREHDRDWNRKALREESK